MELIGENKHAIALLESIYRVVNGDGHFSRKHGDKFKRVVKVHGKTEVFAVFLAEVFGCTEMRVLIKHKNTSKGQTLSIYYMIFGMKCQVMRIIL